MKLGIMKKFSLILVASMLNLCWMTSHSRAEMVGTQAILSSGIPHQITRNMLIDALNGREAKKQLERNGITQEEATARLNSLTDEEISAYWVQTVKTRKNILPENSSPIKREMLVESLNRKQVQQQLEKYGISREEAAIRINSLTDAEVAAIAAKVGPLPAGGDHDYDDEDDDDVIVLILLIFLIVVFIGVILVAYILGVLGKGSYCIFADCEPYGGMGFVFRPWWLTADDRFIWDAKEGNH